MIPTGYCQRLTMFKKDEWPFIPTSLSEILDKGTLSVIEAGCCERLGRATTIINGDGVDRIDPVVSNLSGQRFEGFCSLLRNEKRIRGGNMACKKFNTQAAKESFKRAGQDPYRAFKCHMGLLDATCVIRIQGQPVALLLSGQYQPPEGIDRIKKNVHNLQARRNGSIELLDETAGPELLSLAENLSCLPPDWRERLSLEVEHIQKFAQAEYQRLKNLWEQEFLDKLRMSGGVNGIGNLEQLRQYTVTLLELIQTFCRCEYVIFFASVREDDTVLPPIAEIGIPIAHRKKLPHFNWKKAGLPLENTTAWDFVQEHRAALNGIRGDNSQYFANASCLLRATLGNRYRGMLVLGPFAEKVDVEKEKRFLMEVARTVGLFVLTELEVLHLQQERRQWESTAKLLIHQVGTTLTPITTRIGGARLMVQELTRNAITKEVIDSLQRAEKLCLQLGRSARETVEAHVLLLEPEDLDFEPYPLSVLVANCASGFVPEAKKRKLQLVIEDNVELLPQVEVDAARLTIALSNLIENALKYSCPNTKIFIRAKVEFAGDFELATAIIEVDNLGEEIRLEDQEKIFEQGRRGLTQAKMGRIPGSGLGLWEARAVIEAHGGTISVVSQPTRRQDQAYRVIFSLRIPLRQAK